MKSFLSLIVLTIVTKTYAGVGVLTPEIEGEALQLWQKHCTGDSPGGTEGNLVIFCKKDTNKYEESLSHDLKLKDGEEPKEQVVFIQPPSYHYKHDVIVTGGGGSAPKTVIYVKPSKNTHEVNVQDQTTGGAAPQKPTLYFLKGDHGGDSGAGATAAARSRRHETPDSTAAALTSQNIASAIRVKDESNLTGSDDSSKKPVLYILRRIKSTKM